MLPFPGRCAARSGALLIRGPSYLVQEWVPALRCIVKNAAPRPGHEAFSISGKLARDTFATELLSVQFSK